MRLLLDMNLLPTLADWLRQEGHDVVHARDLGLSDLPDRDVFARANAEQGIVVTFDLDFGEIVGLASTIGPGVVLLRLRSARQQHWRQRLLAALSGASAALAAGAIVVAEDARIRIRRMPPGNG